MRNPRFEIVLDGFDRLPELTREAVHDAIAAWPENIRIILTARPDTSGCPSGQTLDHGMTPRDALDHYLTSRQVPASAHPAILDRAGGHWLLARLLADLIVNDAAIDLAQLPRTVSDAFATLLDQARGSCASNQTFSHVLGLLALAGEGPVLPLSLLVQACQTLAGPVGELGVRAVLDSLGGLVTRRDPGTTDEHDGLFHASLAEYLLDPSASGGGLSLDARAMHEAIIQTIDAQAETAKQDRRDPVHCFAMLREADHLWAIGNVERTLASLRGRELAEPRENLWRWLQWLRRFRERLDEDGAHVLDLRGSIVSWTSRSGEAQEAVRLCAEVLPEAEHALGRDHPITLTTRGRLAYLTGDIGEVKEALRLLFELLADQERALGRNHADLLRTRAYIAHWTRLGDGPTALRSYTELLPDLERMLGRDHADTLAVRDCIAYGTGETGNAQETLRLWSELLLDRERGWGLIIPTRSAARKRRVLGGPCGQTAGKRYGCSSTSCRTKSECWAAITPTPLAREGTSRTGPPRPATPAQALHLRTELLPDQERVLGATMPIRSTPATTSRPTSASLATPREALRLFTELLADQERVLGRKNPHTLRTRLSIASCRGEEVGDVLEKSRLLHELLPDFGAARPREPDGAPRVSEPHASSRPAPPMQATCARRCGCWPNCCRTRSASWAATTNTRSRPAAPSAFATHQLGDAREALRLFAELLPDQERVLGLDHADTLETRSKAAMCTRDLGETREALRLFCELLPDQERSTGR